MKVDTHTKVDLENGNPAFAKPVLGAVPSVVYNEDCVEGLKRFSDNYFDLAIVDPPYGINRLHSGGMPKSSGFKKWERKDWDSEIPKAEYWEQLFRVSKNQIVWGGNYFTEYLKPSQGWIFWFKQKGMTFADGELAWTSFDRATRQYDMSGMGGANRIHPTQKPIKLYDWILEQYGSNANLILDTHVGSGSSRIACNKAGKQFVGFEIDKDYYEAQEKRFKDFVSQLRMF